MARRKSLDRLLALLESPDPEARRDALWKLGRYPFERSRPTRRQREQATAAVLEALVGDQEERARYEAAHLLGYWAEGDRTTITDALLQVLANDAETPRVRAQAAESASSSLHFGSGTPALRARSSALFVELLRHPEAEIRFWCIYAIGTALFIEARPILEELARADDAVCPYMWRVGDEAADVLTVFDGGVWRDRVPGSAD